MDQQKLDFLTKDFIFHLKHLAPDAKGTWGSMNGQQMVEHFSDVVRNASGKLVLPSVNQGEVLQQFRDFLFSDRPFQKNLKNPFMSETPAPVRHETMQSAIAELEKELGYFKNHFATNPTATTTNPFFGELDFSGLLQLLYKHAQHHLKQFGLLNNS